MADDPTKIVIVEEKESWSWLKFFKGFFDGKNYGKAIVFLFCSGIILFVGLSSYTFVKSKFEKPTSAIETNNGTVTTTNTDKKSWSLLNFFNF